MHPIDLYHSQFEQSPPFMLAVTANESAGYITEATANQSEGPLVTSRKSGLLRSHSND